MVRGHRRERRMERVGSRVRGQGARKNHNHEPPPHEVGDASKRYLNNQLNSPSWPSPRQGRGELLGEVIDMNCHTRIARTVRRKQSEGNYMVQAPVARPSFGPPPRHRSLWLRPSLGMSPPPGWPGGRSRSEALDLRSSEVAMSRAAPTAYRLSPEANLSMIQAAFAIDRDNA